MSVFRKMWNCLLLLLLRLHAGSAANKAHGNNHGKHTLTRLLEGGTTKVTIEVDADNAAWYFQNADTKAIYASRMAGYQGQDSSDLWFDNVDRLEVDVPYGNYVFEIAGYYNFYAVLVDNKVFDQKQYGANALVAVPVLDPSAPTSAPVTGGPTTDLERAIVGWRLWSDTSLVFAGWKWDIGTLEFYRTADCSPASKIDPSGGTIISSGWANQENGDLFWAPGKAFDGVSSTLWGGRPTNGEYWIGLEFSQDTEVQCVLVVQPLADEFNIQSRFSGTTEWQDRKLVRGIDEGTITIILEPDEFPTDPPTTVIDTLFSFIGPGYCLDSAGQYYTAISLEAGSESAESCKTYCHEAYGNFSSFVGIEYLDYCRCVIERSLSPSPDSCFYAEEGVGAVSAGDGTPQTQCHAYLLDNYTFIGEGYCLDAAGQYFTYTWENIASITLESCQTHCQDLYRSYPSFHGLEYEENFGCYCIFDASSSLPPSPQPCTEVVYYGSGAVSQSDGSADVMCYAITPPEPTQAPTISSAPSSSAAPSSIADTFVDLGPGECLDEKGTKYYQIFSAPLTVSNERECQIVCQEKYGHYDFLRGFAFRISEGRCYCYFDKERYHDPPYQVTPFTSYSVHDGTGPISGSNNDPDINCYAFKEKAPKEPRTNVALGKPAFQSSTGQSFVASLAVDGNNWWDFSKPPVTLTQTEWGGSSDPWWYVYLQGECTIDSVVVWNRMNDPDENCCSNRLSSAEIRLFRTCPPDRPINFDLTITTDDYPEETTWTLFREGDLVESGGPYSSTVTTYQTNDCLPPGAYEFVISDAYGDGMLCGPGSYTLQAGGQTFTGADFGASASHEFEISDSEDRRLLLDVPGLQYVAERTLPDMRGVQRYEWDTAGITGINGVFITIPGDNKVLTLAEVEVFGDCEIYTTPNPTSAPTATKHRAEIDLQLDSFPEEVAWELSDVLKETVFESRPYHTYNTPGAKVHLEWGLEEETYIFTLKDRLEDGFCCQNGNGTIQVTMDGIVVYEALADFTNELEIVFESESASSYLSRTATDSPTASPTKNMTVDDTSQQELGGDTSGASTSFTIFVWRGPLLSIGFVSLAMMTSFFLML